MESSLNPSLYVWSLHTHIPNLYIRRALGAESKWLRKAQINPRQVLLYLSGELNLPNPIAVADFVERARSAWISLRWQHPEICIAPYLTSTECEDGHEKSTPQMCCPIPVSKEEVNTWADATLLFDFSEQHEEIKMRKAVASLRSRVAHLNRERMPPVSLHFAARCGDKNLDDGVIRGVQFAFCVDHASTDGVGAYLIAGKYFAMLAEHVGGEVDKREADLDWSRCVEHLQEPWIGQMNQEQRTEGVEYDKSVSIVQEKIGKSANCDWGLTIQDSMDRYEPAWLYRYFSPETTAAILRACKEKMGISVTHLGHAATVVATFKGSEPRDLPPDGLTCPLFLNGRRCLESGTARTKVYIPMCRALGFIEFSDADKLALPKNRTPGATCEALSYACSQAQESYKKIQSQRSILTESFTGLESLVIANKHVQASKVKPIFISDGVVEQYIQSSYFDKTQTRNVFSVEEVQFIADPDGSPLVIRICTFRNKLRLSAEWNSACYRKGEIEDFVDEVCELMKLVI